MVKYLQLLQRPRVSCPESDVSFHYKDTCLQQCEIPIHLTYIYFLNCHAYNYCYKTLFFVGINMFFLNICFYIILPKSSNFLELQFLQKWK